MLVSQLCLTLCDPMDCSPPGCSDHGILQEKILEWVDIPFSRGSSRPRDWSYVSCIAGGVFTVWSTTESLLERHALLFAGLLFIITSIWHHTVFWSPLSQSHSYKWCWKESLRRTQEGDLSVLWTVGLRVSVTVGWHHDCDIVASGQRAWCLWEKWYFGQHSTRALTSPLPLY